MDNREFAKSMRDGKSVDIYGNVVCSLDMWEKIAKIIEDQADEIDRLLNLLVKIDTEQAEKIKDLEAKLEETYLSAEGLKAENEKLKAQRYLLKEDGSLLRIPEDIGSFEINGLFERLMDKINEAKDQILKEICDET